MSSKKSRRIASNNTADTIPLYLTREELETLRELAHFYERSMGPMRYVIRLTASSEVRGKYRFIAEESDLLERFVDATLAELIADTGEVPVEFAPRSVVAYWGRVLSSLNSRRSRRRLKPAGIAVRESLAHKLQDALERLDRRSPGAFDREVSTRRSREAEWMQSARANTAS